MSSHVVVMSSSCRNTIDDQPPNAAFTFIRIDNTTTQHIMMFFTDIDKSFSLDSYCSPYNAVFDNSSYASCTEKSASSLIEQRMDRIEESIRDLARRLSSLKETVTASSAASLKTLETSSTASSTTTTTLTTSLETKLDEAKDDDEHDHDGNGEKMDDVSSSSLLQKFKFW